MAEIPEQTIFAQMLVFLSTSRWLAVATNLGLLFSFMAFWQAKRAKRAAYAAKQAVYNLDSVSEITIAISTLNDIQSHLRNGNICVVPDKLIIAHGHLTKVRKGGPRLSAGDKEDLLGVCNQIISIKNAIERAIESDFDQYKFSRTNKILSQQSQRLQEMLETVKRRSV